MLGEKMGSMTATAVTKVLPTDGTLPKFEVTAQGSGTLAGVQVQLMSTYYADMKADVGCLHMPRFSPNYSRSHCRHATFFDIR